MDKQAKEEKINKKIQEIDNLIAGFINKKMNHAIEKYGFSAPTITSCIQNNAHSGNNEMCYEPGDVDSLLGFLTKVATAHIKSAIEESRDRKNESIPSEELLQHLLDSFNSRSGLCKYYWEQFCKPNSTVNDLKDYLALAEFLSDETTPELVQYLSEKTTNYIKSAIIYYSTLIKDIAFGKLFDVQTLALCYFDLKDGIKKTMDEKLTDPGNTKLAASRKEINNMKKSIKEAIEHHNSGTSKFPEKQNQQNCHGNAGASGSDILIDRFLGNAKIKFSPGLFYKNLFSYLPFAKDAPRSSLPISFFPYIGYTHTAFTRFHSPFKKTNTYLANNPILDGDDKNYNERFETLVKIYNKEIDEINSLLSNAAQTPPYTIEANRFLFNNFLHADFISSLDSDLFDTFSFKIHILDLKNSPNKNEAGSPYDYVKSDEALFLLRLLEMMMSFDINLIDIQDRSAYNEKAFSITRCTGEEPSVFKTIPSEEKCADNSIAFLCSMRFIYFFLSSIRNDLNEVLNQALQMLGFGADEIKTTEAVLDKLVPPGKHTLAAKLEKGYDREAQNLIVYLLNLSSDGDFFH